MTLRKPVVIGLVFAAGLMIGLATGLLINSPKNADSSDLARVTRGTLSGDLTMEQAKAVFADCTQHAYQGYVYVFSPNEAQKSKCEEITTTTYNYICTILAGSSNIQAAIYQIRADLASNVASMLGSIQSTLTAGQLSPFMTYSQKVQEYFKSEVGKL